MKFLFTQPTDGAEELLALPWSEPLGEWEDASIIEMPAAGIHRHVVRFVDAGSAIFVLKELPDELARREYRLLRQLADASIPCVEVSGVCADRSGMDSILVTRYLAYSATYRRLLSTMQADINVVPRFLSCSASFCPTMGSIAALDR